MAPGGMFPPAPDLPAPGQLLLVTDELPSPADFLLHRALSTHLKSSKNHHCVLLSVSEGLDRWKVIAGKSNLNLSLSESFAFIDVLKTVKPPSTGAASPSLRPVLDILAVTLESKKPAPSLVILDDITSLEWIGFPLIEIVRFSRALRALCLQSNAALVVRHHLVTPAEPDKLFRHLSQLCAYHMEVRALSSGRSGAVSGEIALHIGPSTHDTKIGAVPRSAAVQYRLSDAGSVFFERGTSGGVL